MKRLLASLLAPILGAFFCFSASAQSVQQAGPWAPGHAPMYLGSGFGQPIVQDSGPAAGGGPGVGINELGLTVRGTGTAPYSNAGTGPLGSNACDYDGPTTGPNHYLCISPNAQGGGLIAYGASGGASPLPFQFNVNGSFYQFPFVTGGIVGPNTSIVNDLACWNNTVGTLLKDCGTAPLQGPVSSTVGDIALWNNTTGTLLKDGGSIGNGLNIATNVLGIAPINATSLFGNPTGSSAVPTSVSVGSGLSLSGSSIGLTQISNNTLLGNTSGGNAAPTAQSVPSCSTALTWTSGTGFGCGSAGARTRLSGATTFYVATTGTNSVGCGLVIGSPCLTAQYVVNFLQSGYDLAGQTATVQFAHGTYTSGVAFNGLLVGQSGPSGLIFQGDCSSGNTEAVLIQPTTQQNSYALAYGAAATIQCQKIDHSKILSVSGGADMISIGQGASATLGDASLYGTRSDLTFGCNINQWNDVTAAFRAYVAFVNDFRIDTASCDVTTTGTTSNGSGTITSLATTTGVAQYMGIAGTNIPADAYVQSFTSNTVTMGCLRTSPCQATGSGSGISFVFAGGGQVFLDLGNGAQAYFNTNGDPSFAILATIANYTFFTSGIIFDNDLSGANAGAVTWVNSGLAHGACVTVEGLSVFTSYNEGTPYLPCNADTATAATAVGSETQGDSQLTVGSATGFKVGDIISDVTSTTGTWTAGGNITVASSTGVLTGAQILGAGVLNGAVVSNISGTTVTPGGCSGTGRCVSSKPTYLSETSSPLIFKNACLQSGTVITSISGTTVGISKPTKASCTGFNLWASGTAIENSIYQ